MVTNCNEPMLRLLQDSSGFMRLFRTRLSRRLRLSGKPSRLFHKLSATISGRIYDYPTTIPVRLCDYPTTIPVRICDYLAGWQQGKTAGLDSKELKLTATPLPSLWLADQLPGVGALAAPSGLRPALHRVACRLAASLIAGSVGSA